jgi:hypothetical protein
MDQGGKRLHTRWTLQYNFIEHGIPEHAESWLLQHISLLLSQCFEGGA